MTELFAGPGMTVMTVVVFAVEALSLLLMVIILLAHWRVRRKQERFFSALLGTEAAQTRHPVLVSLYVLCTATIGLVSLGLFIVQSHLL